MWATARPKREGRKMRERPEPACSVPDLAHLQQAFLRRKVAKGLAILAASAMTLLRVYPASAQDKDGSSTKTPIKHVVVIFQENVSFDHYFGTYPHAKENNDGSKYFKGATCDEDHSYSDEQFAFDGGLMDRFAKVSCKDPNIGPFSTM